MYEGLAKKSTTNHCKEHNVVKYIQWVTTLVSIFIRFALVASQICEIPQNYP